MLEKGLGQMRGNYWKSRQSGAGTPVPGGENRMRMHGAGVGLRGLVVEVGGGMELEMGLVLLSPLREEFGVYLGLM